MGLIRSEDDIRKIVLASEGGTPVYVGDIGEVRLGHAVRQGAALKDGTHEVVGGIVMMLRGENSREVVGRVTKKVREINDSGVLPDGLALVPFYERSSVVEAEHAHRADRARRGVGARAGGPRALPVERARARWSSSWPCRCRRC